MCLRCECYSTHHRVMSQARDDFERFLKAHMSEEEKVIVHLEASLTHSLTHSVTHSPLSLSAITQRTHCITADKVVYSSPPSIFVTTATTLTRTLTRSLTHTYTHSRTLTHSHSAPQNNVCRREYGRAFALASRVT